jgi:hypothetical protein
MTAKRQLRYESFQEILADVEHLQRAGYDMAGQWNLAQVCGHCTTWLKCPVAGYPKISFLTKLPMWIVRKTIAPKVLAEVLHSGEMKSGTRTLPGTVPPADSQLPSMIAELRLAIAEFEAHTGEYAPSPFFGQLTRAQLQKLHLVHCCHHLSFLQPKT